MKLKAWLREEKNMTYAEYKALDDIDRYILFGEFTWDNARLQKKARVGWRPMTEEERKWADEVGEKGRQRYLVNAKIGGLDERGNYTALHHRWD
jgi:hypothetical protein